MRKVITVIVLICVGVLLNNVIDNGDGKHVGEIGNEEIKTQIYHTEDGGLYGYLNFEECVREFGFYEEELKEIALGSFSYEEAKKLYYDKTTHSIDEKRVLEDWEAIYSVEEAIYDVWGIRTFWDYLYGSFDWSDIERWYS